MLESTIVYTKTRWCWHPLLFISIFTKCWHLYKYPNLNSYTCITLIVYLYLFINNCYTPPQRYIHFFSFMRFSLKKKLLWISHLNPVWKERSSTLRARNKLLNMSLPDCAETVTQALLFWNVKYLILSGFEKLCLFRP